MVAPPLNVRKPEPLDASVPAVLVKHAAFTVTSALMKFCVITAADAGTAIIIIATKMPAHRRVMVHELVIECPPLSLCARRETYALYRILFSTA